MYSTKIIHKNKLTSQGYCTIGDPYKGNSDQLPNRWKSKQLVTQRCPKNAANGFFSKLHYKSEPYTDSQNHYSKTQPLENRKLGFGSHDATKTTEFTCQKTTERYRTAVKKENNAAERHRDEEKQREILRTLSNKTIVPPKDKEGLDLITLCAYDLTWQKNTHYDPKCTRDCFYSLPKHAKKDVRRLGSHRPSSASVGEYAWQAKYVMPAHGRRLRK